MGSTFFGLYVGTSGVQANQRSLDVTGHNIANANTKGYSRQEALQGTKTPYTVPGLNRPTSPGQVGTGVEISEIMRYRDSFLDVQFRTENKSMGYWEAKQQTLEKVEVIVNEPSDSGLRTVLDQFWEGWQELSKNPDSLSVRSVVRQRAVAVADTINHMDRLYKELQADLDDNIKVKVGQINSLAQQVYDVNKQIMSIEGSGDNANDLRDKRDALIDEMSKIVDITTSENSLGVVTVNVGGRPIVFNGGVSALTTAQDPEHEGLVQVLWADDRRPVKFQSGELQGLMESRGYVNPDTGAWEGIVPDMRRDLDLIAKTIINETNALHKTGYDLDGNIGGNFFVPVENIGAGITIASGMKLAGDIEANLNKIAAASDTIAGNGDNALKLAQLKHKLLVDLSGSEAIKDVKQTRDNAVLDQAGIEKTFVPTDLLIGGTVFAAADFNNDAALVIEQGGQQIRVSLKDPTGVPFAGTVQDFVDQINSTATAAGLQVRAALVEDDAVAGTYRLLVQSTVPGEEYAVTVTEENFVGATTFGFEDSQASAAKMEEYSVVRQDGVTKVDITGATEAAALATTVISDTDGAGVLFTKGDFLANGELVVQQGTKSFSIALTDAAGNAVTGFGTYAGATLGSLISYINDEATAQGMDIYAQLVPDENNPTKFSLQIKSLTQGEDKEVRILEKNFKNDATFGFINPAGTGTIDDYYRSQIGKLGVKSEEATRMVENQNLLVNQLDNQRMSYSGVSLDEEMSNMIKFQHAYNASARLITVVDEMLDKIINGTGVTR